MTKEQWLSLKVGDVLVDHMSADAERTVLSVRRYSGKRGQRGNTRTEITLECLRGAHRRPVWVMSTDDVRGQRFSLRDAPEDSD